MENSIDYPQELRTFLAWCAPRLEELLDAGGVREVWLQGEAYRYFRFHRSKGPLALYTNAYKKNDLAFYGSDADHEPDAVVEVKLYGRAGYYSKNLTGHSSMTPYREPAKRERFVFTPDHAIQCHPKEGSILKDYRKLLAQQGRRYMLLVLDTRQLADNFGRAIQRVDFGGKGTSLLRTAKCAATLWEVA